MFTDAELADLRETANYSLSGKCSLVRHTKVRQTNNSWLPVDTTIGTDIPCRKIPSGQTPQERVTIEIMDSSRAVATFLLPAIYDVYREDVIVYMGTNYEVAGVQERTDEIYSRVIVYDKSKEPVV